MFASAAHVIDGVSPLLALACGLLVAGGVHTVKSVAVRPAVTAATGGTANVPVSIAEDILSTVLSILSIVIPILVGVILVVLLALVIWWFWRRANRKRAAVS